MFELLKQGITFKRLISFLVVLCSLIWLSVFSFPDSKFHLVFCDVGQGDAILLTKGLTQVLIDGGPNDKVLQCLANNLPFFDRTLEVVVLTHPEADHLTGLLSVLDKYRVDNFFAGPEGNNSAVFAELSSKLKAQNSIHLTSSGLMLSKVEALKLKRKTQNFPTRIRNPYTGETIKIGEITLQTLWPERNFVSQKLSNIAENSNQELSSSSVLGMQTGNLKLNQFSLVFLLKYKNFSAILMGDADQTVQNDILIFNSLIPLDILKFPHHGSKTGMSESFLQTIKPKEAVISVGKNSYGHPTTEALDLLKKYGVKTRRTDLEGEIRYNVN